MFTEGSDESAFFSPCWVNKPWRDSAAHPWWVRLKQQLRRLPGQILAATFIWKRGWPGLWEKFQSYKTTSWPHFDNSSSSFTHARWPKSLCVNKNVLDVLLTVCLYLAVRNLHLCFVPAVRLSLWVHRVWCTRVTMESGGPQQGRNMHRPPRSSQRHSVQWVSSSYISLYTPWVLIKCVIVSTFYPPSVSCHVFHIPMTPWRLPLSSSHSVLL